MLLTACGGFDGRIAAGEDIFAPAAMAAGAINDAFGCEVVKLHEGDLGKWHDGVSEVRFSTEFIATADGFTHVDAEPGAPQERDILVRPKPATTEYKGHVFVNPPPDYASVIVHELGHAFGLEHVVARGEIMHPAGGDSKDPEMMAHFVASLKQAGVSCKGGR